jgi:hypothetical protein
MCWLEKQYPNCLLCNGVGVPYTRWMGCPFNQPEGECNSVFETSTNIFRPHPECVEINRISEEVRLENSGEAPLPAYGFDERVDVDPMGPPAPAIPVPTTSDSTALPAGWAAGSNNEPSYAMRLATHRRDELVRMASDLFPTVAAIETTIGSLNPLFAQLIEWTAMHITAVVTVANQTISQLETEEFDVANNTANAESARERIGWLLEGIAYNAWPYENALTWHRRYTDLITYLRGLAGQISPPRPVDNDTLPPMMRRRGAIAGLDDAEPTDNSEPIDASGVPLQPDDPTLIDYRFGPDSMAGSPVDAEPTDHSDFLPPPGFYTPYDWFGTENENGADHDPQNEESNDDGDDETMGESES